MRLLAVVVLAALALSAHASVTLRGTVLVNSDQETGNLVDLTLVPNATASIRVIADLSSLGALLSAHTLRWGPQQQHLFLVTLDLASATNTIHQMTPTGTVLASFTAAQPMATLEYSAQFGGWVTASVDPQTMDGDLATIDIKGQTLKDQFSMPAFVNAGVSTIHPVTGVFYTYAEVGGAVSLWRVQTEKCKLFHCPAWTGTHNFTTGFNPLAMEYFNSSLIVANTDTFSSQIDIWAINPHTLHGTVLATLDPQWTGDISAASTIYNNVFYLAVSTSDGISNSVAALNLITMQLQYYSTGATPVISLLPPAK